MFGIKNYKADGATQGPLSKKQQEFVHKHSLAKIFYEVCDNPNSNILQITEEQKRKLEDLMMKENKES